MKKTLKWFAVIMGVIVIIGAIGLVFEGDDDKEAREFANKQGATDLDQTKAKNETVRDQPLEVSDTPISTLVADNQPDPTIGGKSRMEVFAECQIAIKEKLNNPRSFDVKTRDVIHKKYEDGGEHLVGFKFYAKNQLNAESEHMAVCAFDSKGERLTAEYK